MRRFNNVNYRAFITGLLFLLCSISLSLGQNVTITNLTQLVNTAFSTTYSLYVPWTPWQWDACPTDNQPWCLDCSQIDCTDLLSTSTNACATIQLYEITVTSIVFTKNVLTGETLVQSGCSTDTLFTVEAPDGYDPNTQTGEIARVWQSWQQMTNCPDCWGLTNSDIPPPLVTLGARLADASDYSLYESNLAAAYACGTNNDDGGGGGSFSSDDEGDDFTCSVDTSAFTIVSITQDTNSTTLVASPTCTNYLIGWFSTDTLPVTTNWTPRTGGWAGNGSSTWTDISTTGVSQRFYYAQLDLPTTTIPI